MSKLIYIANMSIDGYTEDPQGRYDWTVPSDEKFIFITNIVKKMGTHLYGRRMYETMKVWETDPNFSNASPLLFAFAETWQAADKIVYSRTLKTVSTHKTRLERNFESDDIRRLKDSLEKDIMIGGPELAAHAYRNGLIDECHLFLIPITVGGGKKAFPDDLKIKMELLEERRFECGEVYLRYQIKQ